MLSEISQLQKEKYLMISSHCYTESENVKEENITVITRDLGERKRERISSNCSTGTVTVRQNIFYCSIAQWGD
jgi:chemotaxis receptor (MCP) glutamine deamidase CheD